MPARPSAPGSPAAPAQPGRGQVREPPGRSLGPLIVLLHGFPEFWYGWRQQIQPLAAAGFRVVAPDTRGYNLSSKPDGVAAYNIDQPGTDQGLVSSRVW
jgi:pimeloyl-ACP methyl ester carboxylesterase